MFEECPNGERETQRPGATVDRSRGSITVLEVHIGVSISRRKSTPSSCLCDRMLKNTLSEINLRRPFLCLLLTLALRAPGGTDRRRDDKDLLMSRGPLRPVEVAKLMWLDTDFGIGGWGAKARDQLKRTSVTSVRGGPGLGGVFLVVRLAPE